MRFIIYFIKRLILLNLTNQQTKIYETNKRHRSRKVFDEFD